MPSFDEIAATTLAHRVKTLSDGVSENNSLLTRLRSKGNNKKVSGGDFIRQTLSHSENSTATMYDGGETISVAQNNVIGFADFEWKQAAASVVITGKEKMQNAGSERVFDLLEERIQVAEDSMKNLIASGVYSDGTGFSGKAIGGLQLLVPDDPTTGTAGTINRATAGNEFWRSIKYAGVADGSAAVSSSNIQKYMTSVYTQLVRNQEAPDLICADSNYWTLYHEYLSGIQRIVMESNSDVAKSGFPTLRYMNADVVLDGGVGGSCPANHMYFLNTKYIFLKTHAQRDFVVLNGTRQAIDQDAFVKLMGWMGNMTAGNLRLQGVLIA
jgi:hypothetical protein